MLTAQLLGPSPPIHNPLPPGSALNGAGLGTRTFVTATHGFALWDDLNDTYPAVTTDGGKTWQVDGPILHVAAADGAAAVTAMGAAPPDTAFAWGGGSAVDVTTDGGTHWYAAFLGDGVVGVADVDSAVLTAVVDGPFPLSGAPPLWLYQSRDGGRRWNYIPGSGP